MDGITFYYYGESQPCRAVRILLEMEGIPHTLRVVKIFKGEQKQGDFAKMFPNAAVPAIDDNGFHLFESAAILRYLTAQYKTPDHWYPQAPQKRAKIDEYLDWHHSNLRRGAAVGIFYKHLLPMITGKAPDQTNITNADSTLKKSFTLLETYFLKDTKFINSPEISIADLMAVCEFTQFWIVGEDVVKDKPRLQKWLDDCKEALSPHFDKAHEYIYYLRDNGVKKLLED